MTDLQATGRRNRRRLVRICVEVLATGEPTLFRWEAHCRYTLRTALCLSGNSWPLSDAIAADLVRRALHVLQVERPPWIMGQREYLWDSNSTRVAFSHCVQCGRRLNDGQLKFCGPECGARYRQIFASEDFRARERERVLAYRAGRRARAEPRQCETCGAWFRSGVPKQRFCSRQCSGSRSVKRKMNGAHHPWMNGKSMQTGGNGVNGAENFSLRPPPSGNDSAIADASVVTTTRPSHASAPRSAPS